MKTPGPGRPKDPAKRRAILEAAKTLFPRHGYDGTSMDAVAALAGVSKLTVYNHFGDKDTLFTEAVRERCESQLPHALFERVASARDLRSALMEIARRTHELVHSEEAMQLHRIMAGQGPGAHKLAQLFYQAGPRRLLDEFEGLLARAHADGRLHAPDPALAAGHFFCLVKGLAHMQVLIGVRGPVQPAEAATHLASVVELFLRAHTPPTPCQKSG